MTQREKQYYKLKFLITSIDLFLFLTSVFRSKHWKVHIDARSDVLLAGQPKEPVMFNSIHSEWGRTMHREIQVFHMANHPPTNPPEEML